MRKPDNNGQSLSASLALYTKLGLTYLKCLEVQEHFPTAKFRVKDGAIQSDGIDALTALSKRCSSPIKLHGVDSDYYKLNKVYGLVPA